MISAEEAATTAAMCQQQETNNLLDAIEARYVNCFSFMSKCIEKAAQRGMHELDFAGHEIKRDDGFFDVRAIIRVLEERYGYKVSKWSQSQYEDRFSVSW